MSPSWCHRQHFPAEVAAQLKRPMHFVDFLREPTTDPETGEVIDAHPSVYESVPSGLPDVRQDSYLNRLITQQSKDKARLWLHAASHGTIRCSVPAAIAANKLKAVARPITHRARHKPRLWLHALREASHSIQMCRPCCSAVANSYVSLKALLDSSSRLSLHACSLKVK